MKPARPPGLKAAPDPPYKGRLAPSPTGFLHLGHARTFATAAARAASGTLLLRIDDLDPDRTRPEFIDALYEDLDWLGFSWQLPAILQSGRISLYFAALTQLLTQGLAYPCTCSRRDLERALAAPHEDRDDELPYTGHCRPVEARPQYFTAGCNYRFRVPHRTIAFLDGNLGPQRFLAGAHAAGPTGFGDFLLWRRDGLPSYQLATVVDDSALRITEVVRGRDLLRSTARQLLLYEALKLPAPAWFHTELTRDEHGLRLAKRHDALSLRTLRAQGLTPEEVLAV